ncbi:MAG TPA: sugar ABC transporter ATP-binding protein, partial [Rhizobium sp.]
IGENGAGKSTLLNILSGIVQPNAGRMELIGLDYRPQSYHHALAYGISRVFQEQALVPNVPIYENLLIGEEKSFSSAGFVQRRKMIAAAQRIVEEAEIDIDVRRKTSSYDFSRRQSIEIARACLATSHLSGVTTPLVLLDEPTSALDRQDEEAFFRLMQKMKRRGSLVFISHRLSEVIAHSDIIYVLKDGRLVARIDDPRETDEKTLHGLMVGRVRSADYYKEARQLSVTTHPVRLQASSLSRKGVFDNVSVTLRAGEIVGIGGLLDSGKSAVGKAIAGVSPPDVGTVRLNDGAADLPDIIRQVRKGIGYVPAERLVDGIIASFPVAWNLTLASGSDLFSNALGFWNRRREISETERYIRELRIRSATPNLKSSSLSGGNQQKVVLSRWLCREPKFLVLDNPTRGVDAGAKEEIYGIIRNLADQGVGILLITDELLELIGLSNRILIMQRGRVVTEIAAHPDSKPGERDVVSWMLPSENAAAARPDTSTHHTGILQ